MRNTSLLVKTTALLMTAILLNTGRVEHQGSPEELRNQVDIAGALPGSQLEAWIEAALLGA